MTAPTKNPFRELSIQAARSMWHTFYWIDEALQHHIQEFQAQPELLARLAGQPEHPIDMVARLERLRQDARQLERDIDRVKYRSRWLEDAMTDREPAFDELSPDQAASLKHMDEQLNGVARHIQQTAQAIDAALVGSMADPANRLQDRNISLKASFHLREDDLAYLDDSDDIVAEVQRDCLADCGNPISEESFFGTASWPDGFDETFPMPHGGLMHHLRLYGGYERGRVDYRDLLRIGSVWVDVVVEHQYQFDLVQGKWIKRWDVDHAQNTRQPVFVRDE